MLRPGGYFSAAARERFGCTASAAWTSFADRLIQRRGVTAAVHLLTQDPPLPFDVGLPHPLTIHREPVQDVGYVVGETEPAVGGGLVPDAFMLGERRPGTAVKTQSKLLREKEGSAGDAGQ